MWGSILTWLSIFTVSAGGIAVLASIVGATVYDIQSSKLQRRYKKNLNKTAYKKRPLITVMVSTHDNLATIERCLNSLLTSSYRKIEIIVVDNNSSDGTINVIKTIISQHPKRTIKLVSRRSSTQYASALLDGYKKHGHGDLIMMLSPNSMLDKQALINAVRRFKAQPDVGLLLTNRQAISELTMLSLFQKYKDILGSAFMKCRSLSGAIRFIETDLIGSAPALTILLKKASQVSSGSSTFSFSTLSTRSLYASDVLIDYQSPTSFYKLWEQNYMLLLSRMLENVKLQSLKQAKLKQVAYTIIVSILELVLVVAPAMVTYFIYLAIKLQEPTLLIATVAALSVFILSALVDDEHSRWFQKASYILGLPLTYFWFYVSSSTRSILVCIRLLSAGVRLKRESS